MVTKPPRADGIKVVARSSSCTVGGAQDHDAKPQAGFNLTVSISIGIVDGNDRKQSHATREAAGDAVADEARMRDRPDLFAPEQAYRQGEQACWRDALKQAVDLVAPPDFPLESLIDRIEARP
ncbi:hypothetical protein [Pseudoponticoccus marisrubri]|uniref:hypothetical protein n=1 Tax=Pseudoponticoccus marisrubri TaxID=1685382 RepID=UPI0012FD494D|nr:hypothetical protein [Pseudoponticoccus marisrubri]